MAKKRLKPLLSSLREKKRYVAYEVISESRFGAIEVRKAITDAAQALLGDLGVANAGLIEMDDQWNETTQRGIMRVNNKHINHLRASLLFVQSIQGKDSIIRSVGASGVLRKAQQQYVN